MQNISYPELKPKLIKIMKSTHCPQNPAPKQSNDLFPNADIRVRGEPVQRGCICLENAHILRFFFLPNVFPGTFLAFIIRMEAPQGPNHILVF